MAAAARPGPHAQRRPGARPGRRRKADGDARHAPTEVAADCLSLPVAARARPAGEADDAPRWTASDAPRLRRQSRVSRRGRRRGGAPAEQGAGRFRPRVESDGGTGSRLPVSRVVTAEDPAGRRALPGARRRRDESWSRVAGSRAPGAGPADHPLPRGRSLHH